MEPVQGREWIGAFGGGGGGGGTASLKVDTQWLLLFGTVWLSGFFTNPYFWGYIQSLHKIKHSQYKIIYKSHQNSSTQFPIQ